MSESTQEEGLSGAQEREALMGLWERQSAETGALARARAPAKAAPGPRGAEPEPILESWPAGDDGLEAFEPEPGPPPARGPGPKRARSR